uniref:Zinc finger C2HC domain-containing protein 1A n=1 Tax=Phallusia mammillata TaxID=59560 RepID=A0A6F9DXY4_9ASCI|nr:zinc finger C2HC domain-containing protein 1A-like [Phallusia mammillata]
MDFGEDDYGEENMPIGHRVSCQYCRRKFAPESVARHSKICEKTHVKRPVFNSSKQRDVTCTPGVQIKPSKSQPAKKTQRNALPAQGNKQSWKQKHEDFINTIRTAREATAAIKEGRKPPPHVASAPNPDYVQCPHCSRRFNNSAAERHIVFCAEQAKRLTNKKSSPVGASTQAAARAAARVKYKPPSLKPSTGPRRSDGVESRSAPARVTRARMEQSPNKYKFTGKYDSNQYSSPSFANGFGKPPSGTGSSKKTHRDWDASIEPSSYKPAARSKTGLKPANGSVSEDDLYLKRNSPQPKTNKPLVRKVAGKGDMRLTAQGAQSRHMRPRHEWSSDSIHSDSDSDNGGYSTKAYRELNRNLQSPHSSSKRYQPGSKTSKITVHQPKDFPTYTRRSPTTRSPVTNGDVYDWLPSSQNNAYGGSNTPSPSQSSRFCHECGARYPIANAKFCCECGIRRIMVT